LDSVAPMPMTAARARPRARLLTPIVTSRAPVAAAEQFHSFVARLRAAVPASYARMQDALQRSAFPDALARNQLAASSLPAFARPCFAQQLLHPRQLQPQPQHLLTTAALQQFRFPR
jgi:hypothetical protein